MQTSPRYIPTVEMAKIIRATLKKEFPEKKFKVQSSKYSGGSSIRIVVPKGETQVRRDVDLLLHDFAGSGFDGMIDMAYSKDTWFNPKTLATAPAKSSGTEGSRGTAPAYDNPAPTPEFELVHFSSSHIFVEEEWR